MASRTPPVEERSPCRFSSSLSSAILEWILIFLLILNGSFSYLVTKFARYCKLQIPCLFCSRFDHVLECESPSFYDNLICTPHKLKISSLAYCHIHQKLADVRETCESCFLSFSTNKKFDSEMYRSVVGKLEIAHNKDNIIPKFHETAENERSQTKFQTEDTADMRAPLFQSSRVASFKLKNDDVFGFKRLCSCCTEPFRLRLHAHRLLQAKSVEADVTEPEVPALCLTPRDHSVSHNVLNKRNELTPPAVSNGGGGLDKLSHIGYKELKFTSDSETEVPIANDVEGNTLIGRPTNIKKEGVSNQLESGPPPVTASTLSKTSIDGTAPEQMTQVDSITPSVLLTVPEKHVIITDGLSDSSACKMNIGKSPALEELNWDGVGGAPCSADSDTFSRPIATEASNAKVEISKELGSTEAILKPSQATNEPVLPIPNAMDLNDAYKLVIVSKHNEPSPKDSSQVPEDLKLLLTQISRSLESPWNDMITSPRMHGLFRQNSRISEGSGISGQLNLPKRLSLDRNESGFESSFDGSSLGDVDGESAIDKLKRHMEMDRKSLSILYKELEEERNASAIAANQAMAMITRLQEEKATMQMEALQYQRMMEEQAEYDHEALQKQYDLLAEKEKEIQELEAELVRYRRRFDYRDEEHLLMAKEENGISKICTPHSKQVLADPITAKPDSFFLDLNMNKSTILRDSLLDFEEEKLYIYERLKELEKKLHLCSKVGSDCQTKVSKVPAKNTYLHEEENNQIASNASSFLDDSVLSREDSHSKASTLMNNHENGLLPPISSQQNKQPSTFGTEVEATNVEHEISDLKNRLESLEEDRYFLEHMINSLHNGKEGLLFVQQIAQHLEELRKIRIG